jgi:hypothetical protein
MSYSLCLSALTVTLLISCAQPRTPAVSRQPPFLSPPTRFPLRNESDAGILVTNLALQKRIVFEDYEPPLVKFNADRRSWIFYTLKPPGMPGGHFWITVQENGRTKFDLGE